MPTRNTPSAQESLFIGEDLKPVITADTFLDENLPNPAKKTLKELVDKYSISDLVQIDSFKDLVDQVRLSDLLLSRLKERKSTLLVKPTGTGKTVDAILWMASVLANPDFGRCIFLAPTSVLVHQTYQQVKKFLNLTDDQIAFHTQSNFSGEDRSSHYKNPNCKIIISTGETLHNDLILERLDPSGFCFCLDEAHRLISVKNDTDSDYCYSGIIAQIKNPLLLITATPAVNKEKLKELCDLSGLNPKEDVFDVKVIKAAKNETKIESIPTDLQYKASLKLLKLLSRTFTDLLIPSVNRNRGVGIPGAVIAFALYKEQDQNHNELVDKIVRECQSIDKQLKEFFTESMGQFRNLSTQSLVGRSLSFLLMLSKKVSESLKYDQPFQADNEKKMLISKLSELQEICRYHHILNSLGPTSYLQELTLWIIDYQKRKFHLTSDKVKSFEERMLEPDRSEDSSLIQIAIQIAVGTKWESLFSPDIDLFSVHPAKIESLYKKCVIIDDLFFNSGLVSFKEKELLQIVEQHHIQDNQDKIIVYVGLRNHAEYLAGLIESHLGYPKKTFYITGSRGSNKGKANENLKMFNQTNGSILIMTSVGLEGLHVDHAQTLIIFDHVSNPILRKQLDGRVGRDQNEAEVISLLSLNSADIGRDKRASERKAKAELATYDAVRIDFR